MIQSPLFLVLTTPQRFVKLFAPNGQAVTLDFDPKLNVQLCIERLKKLFPHYEHSELQVKDQMQRLIEPAMPLSNVISNEGVVTLYFSIHSHVIQNPQEVAAMKDLVRPSPSPSPSLFHSIHLFHSTLLLALLQ